ncbi:MAG: aldehyde ferredoxin oxidoreductase C-terminal domain-containing protein, partial [Desulfobacterales bacterium]
NSTGMCFFGAITSTLPLVDWLNAVTGWDLPADEYFKTGERILSLRKAFNVREGIKPDDHKLNHRALGKAPLQVGPLKGAAVDMEALEKEFFDSVGWDPVTGGPTAEKMKALGIDSLCE